MKAFPNKFESAEMDLRDYFAAKAMQSILHVEMLELAKNDGHSINLLDVAESAYEFANVMMEARENDEL